MINYVYQLVQPQFFSIKFKDIDVSGKVVVRPRYMAICQADQRYYLGQRDINALREKLPMALIHECCGTVLVDKSGTYKPGQPVVIVPNTPTRDCGHIYENYDAESYFMSSGSDGFMREFVDVPADRVIPCDNIPMHIAAISELFSVAIHAINRMDLLAHEDRETIGIWGDGSVAYTIATALRAKMPNSQIVVVGKNSRKLSRFSFVNKTQLTYGLSRDFKVDHAFECVGGEGSFDAINDIIEHISPQGLITLLGVSENRVPINTRMVLEKGLTLVGCSRSGKAEFQEAVSLMQTQKIRRRLGSIVYEDAPVRCIEDLHRVFATDLNTPFKTVFEWKI